ncbi:MAG: Fic family protein [Fidelibacterota bacterium]
MKDIKAIKRTLNQFRRNNVRFISVNNSEWYSLFRDEIRNSIAIEGIFANRSELLSVLEEGHRTTNQKTAAILGYYEAASALYEYADNLYKTGEFKLRLSDLKQIHTLLLRYEHQVGTFTGVLGGFRKEDVVVTQSNFTPLNYLNLPDTLPVYVNWVNAYLQEPRFDLLTFITASHVLFETIHPFRDGNGRVGRILLSYLLIGNGLINISIKGTKTSDRNVYYHALEEGDNEIEKLLRRIEKGETPTITRMNKAIEKSHLKPMNSIILNRLNYSLNRVEIDVKTMDQDALIPLRDAARFYNYSQDYLRQLIHLGKLPAQKRGKLWVVRVSDMIQYKQSAES